MNHIIDNLQTKQNLSYDDVYQKLMDLHANDTAQSGSDKSYYSKDQKGKNRSKKAAANNSGSNSLKPNGSRIQECTWCKSRDLSFNGHEYQDSCRLKRHQEKQKSKSAKAKVANDSDTADQIDRAFIAVDQAAVDYAFSTSTNSNTHSVWVFDTGATKHMSSDFSLFHSVNKYIGTVTLADDSHVDATGIGEVRLTALLPDGSTHKVRLQNVLLVPKLGRTNLLS